jgi:hypothetical protein
MSQQIASSGGNANVSEPAERVTPEAIQFAEFLESVPPSQLRSIADLVVLPSASASSVLNTPNNFALHQRDVQRTANASQVW